MRLTIVLLFVFCVSACHGANAPTPVRSPPRTSVVVPPAIAVPEVQEPEPATSPPDTSLEDASGEATDARRLHVGPCRESLIGEWRLLAHDHVPSRTRIQALLVTAALAKPP